MYVHIKNIYMSICLVTCSLHFDACVVCLLCFIRVIPKRTYIAKNRRVLSRVGQRSSCMRVGLTGVPCIFSCVWSKITSPSASDSQTLNPKHALNPINPRHLGVCRVLIRPLKLRKNRRILGDPAGPIPERGALLGILRLSKRLRLHVHWLTCRHVHGDRLLRRSVRFRQQPTEMDLNYL